jgi:phosphatidylserine decarboxylase
MIHKEGFGIILSFFLFLTLLNVLAFYFFKTNLYVTSSTLMVTIVIFFLVVWFFRNPERNIPEFDNNIVYAPADGKIVMIDTVDEPEYFNDQRIQISIFMSPLNVHVNRYPVSGSMVYKKYHPGKYLVAWHEKSSLLNERSTVVLRSNNNVELLIRQIAGAVARRIVTYGKEGDVVKQGNDLGFIKFGSRVDIFLPLNAEINVKVGDISVGNKTILARVK